MLVLVKCGLALRVVLMDGKNTILFSKESDEWITPKELFDKLDKEFDFFMDAAAN